MFVVKANGSDLVVVVVVVFLNFSASVMFKFADQQTVRKVVRALPPVGVGAHYGIPQTRFACSRRIDIQSLSAIQLSLYPLRIYFSRKVSEALCVRIHRAQFWTQVILKQWRRRKRKEV